MTASAAERLETALAAIQGRNPELAIVTSLDAAGARYFRHPHSNIVAIASDSIDARLAAANWLVPDDHEAPAWFKIVVMDHVTDDKLKPFLAALSADIS